jgi:hypothetical protein
MEIRRSILAQTKHVDPQAGMPKEEPAIDEMVATHQLYGLTEDEIKIVERKDKS